MTSIERTRRYRARREKGEIIVQVTLDDSHVRALLRRGYLRGAQDEDETRVTRKGIAAAIREALECL